MPASFVQLQAPVPAQARWGPFGLDFEQYCEYMHDRGDRLTDAELRRGFDDVSAAYARSYDSYDEFIKSGVAQSSERKGGAYNFQGQQDRKMTPLIEFLRWQEWYVQYCKLRNIGQHAYK